MRRLFRNGSGSVSNCQAYFLVFMGMDRAVGIWMKMLLSLPPVSSSSTRWRASSVRRLASTQPAEPAPTMM